MGRADLSGLRLLAFGAGQLAVPVGAPAAAKAAPAPVLERDRLIRDIMAWGQPAAVSARSSASNGPPRTFFSDRETAQYRLYGGTEALWLGGSAEARTYLRWILEQARQRGETPVIVQYAIPGRDRGGPSSGGAASIAGYLADVEANARLIGDSPAMLVIEPDALALGLDARAVRGAVEAYKRLCPNARVYIDAGHSAWRGVDDMAARLVEGGIGLADGFALNVSAFQWTQDNLAYGDRLVEALARRDPALAGKQFVIDTSRNGNGPGVDEQGQWTWGDPVRAQNGGPIMTGPPPTTATGDANCAAFLWIKGAGKGDNRTRPAGQFGGAAWVQPTRQPRLGP